MNEHGVAIGNEKIWTVDDPHALPPALLGMDLVRIGLERGRTADDAREAITSRAHRARPGRERRAGYTDDAVLLVVPRRRRPRRLGDRDQRAHVGRPSGWRRIVDLESDLALDRLDRSHPMTSSPGPTSTSAGRPRFRPGSPTIGSRRPAPASRRDRPRPAAPRSPTRSRRSAITARVRGARRVSRRP